MKQSILYLEPNRGIFYNEENPSMLQLDFPPDVVKDLDLLNKDKLYALIQAFVETYQILPTLIILLLSPSITFEKDILPDQPESEIQTFTDLIPFQMVLSHIFTLGDKKKIVTANKEFIDALQRGFQKVHCDITIALPFSVIQEIMPELANNFDLSFVLSKIDSFKQYNMLKMQEARQNIMIGSNAKPKPASKRLFVLLGVFGALFIIMIIMAVSNLAPQKPPKTEKSVKGINTYKSTIPFYIIHVGK